MEKIKNSKEEDRDSDVDEDMDQVDQDSVVETIGVEPQQLGAPTLAEVVKAVREKKTAAMTSHRARRTYRDHGNTNGARAFEQYLLDHPEKPEFLETLEFNGESFRYCDSEKNEFVEENRVDTKKISAEWCNIINRWFHKEGLRGFMNYHGNRWYWAL